MVISKEKYKSDFKKALETFAKKLQQYVATETGEWSVTRIYRYL
jgi:hypothetical protein